MEKMTIKYTTVDTMGKGERGELYLLCDLSLGRNVAITKSLIRENAVFSEEDRSEIFSQFEQ